MFLRDVPYLGYTYEFEQISSAVQKGYGQAWKPAVKCDYDKELKASVLAQISICLDKVSNNNLFKCEDM